MASLYTYCIPYDDGAAPNPFWGVCTLAICKPAIRRTADKGDWVVGTGSRNSPMGDISNQVVYAMEVTEVLTTAEYDTWSRKSCPNKIPDWKNSDIRRRLGDAIYDYSVSPPRQRQGVHNSGNIETDLSGKNVLLSKKFYYFGNVPQPLPQDLQEIVKQGQGHRVRLNQPYVGTFLKWIGSLGLEPNRLYGEPEFKLFEDEVNMAGATIRAACAGKDSVCQHDL